MTSPSDAFANPKVEAVRRFLSRYQPFIVTITAIALIAILLPGRNTSSGPDETATQVTTDTGSDLPADVGAEGDVAAGTKDTATDPSVVATAPRPVDTEVLTAEEAVKQGVELVANCDRSTKRIMLPLRDAPPCTQRFTGTNAGASWQGVDAKKIKVVYFIASDNPATDAILTAAGANDSEEEVRQQVIEWGKLYEAHLNMWGRKVEWTFVNSSAPASAPDDDAAARADAIKVTGMKPFASINAPANIYVDELKAKGILCMCTVSLPIETYIKWYPYVWTTLMASTQGYIHRAQYAAGRLANRNAQWAYDSIDGAIGQNFQSQKRKFGFLYYDTDAKAYKSGADFFVKHMREKYGITFCKDCVSEYHGFPQVQRTQEESPGIIQRMKAAGVTSIICSCDPFGPIFFTKDAQQQLYGPEWIITGSALTDTSFFARLYQQDQWSHAFGISYLSARLPEQFSGSYRLYRWQYNREPTARAGYGVINAPISILYYGIQMAGSKLTPTTFASGLENLGIQNRGTKTSIAYSFGDNGLWQWKIDTAAADDATEIWWDRRAQGEDEIGQDGTGLYRYVLGGKRYMPGEWPTTNPSAFNPKGTITIYDKPPASDAWPCYTSPATKKKDRC